MTQTRPLCLFSTPTKPRATSWSAIFWRIWQRDTRNGSRWDHFLAGGVRTGSSALSHRLHRMQPTSSFPWQWVISQVWYTLDRPPEGWAYSTGFITDVMISEHLPPPADDTLILMCGPPPMIEYACKANLNKLGYSKDAQVAF
mmetsp:Transcript_23033/g.63048  ORF Transcript_23033/g.63048 Transcript_23033/m.63048 type:complete len:143 (-) Transcript_23033:335-763(-)